MVRDPVIGLPIWVIARADAPPDPASCDRPPSPYQGASSCDHSTPRLGLLTN